MSSSAPSPLTFEKFWKWVLEHPSCILRVSSDRAALFDHDDFHWDFFDDDEGNAVVQLLKGKQLVGEFAIDRRDIVMVQASVDIENPQSGHWVFDLVGSDAEQGGFQFLLAHGMDQHGEKDLKH